MRRGISEPNAAPSLLLLAAVLTLMVGVDLQEASALKAPPLPAQASAPAPQGETQITADSPPYRIEWDGTRGTFIRKAFGGEPEQKMPLVYLHSDAGPTGYSKHLAWFLARGEDSFALLWLYINDSGTEFTSWTYRYPANELTALKFTGDYRFKPLSELPPAASVEKLDLHALTRYAGPEFGYKQWTAQVGGLDRLDLFALKKPADASAPPTPTPSTPSPTAASPIKTLKSLHVVPLHEVEVAAKNGWRADGWRELHVLAFDSTEEPYYLILYTNTTRGYAIDLKRGQTYTADFGEKVRFAEGSPSSSQRSPGGKEPPKFGPEDNPLNNEPEIRLQRYERFEITLTSKTKYDHPYKDVIVGAEVHTPGGKSLLIPGYWDGGDTWRIRFTPTAVGTWSWRTRSKDLDLSGLEGQIECIEGDTPLKGFLSVQPSYLNTRHFAYADGKPFLPAYLRDPVHRFSTDELGSASTPPKSGEISFKRFQERIDACAALGFNRFIGGYLLEKPDSPSYRQVNEGGEMFLGGDPDKINPAYFQWMDKRIAYCNAKGIVPDLGLGWLSLEMFSKYQEEQLFRLWYYILSRYSTFDVCWNLLGGDDASPLTTSLNFSRQLNEFTRLYDFYHHPVTIIAPNLALPPGSTLPVAPWMDIVTLQSGDLNTLYAFWRVNKPIVLAEQAAITDGKPTPMASDIARKRMWETRMRGAYWAGGLSPALAGMSALDSPEIKAAAACAEFFRQTRFSHLEPHQEMLGGPEESPADRRRRKKAEAAAAKLKPVPPPNPDSIKPQEPNKQGSPEQPPKEKEPAAKGSDAPVKAAAPPPVFVLADPAWEYVIYFEQGGSILLDLLEATGRVKVVWFNPRTGQSSPEEVILGGAYSTFTAPDSNDWVLHLSRR